MAASAPKRLRRAIDWGGASPNGEEAKGCAVPAAMGHTIGITEIRAARSSDRFFLCSIGRKKKRVADARGSDVYQNPAYHRDEATTGLPPQVRVPSVAATFFW